MKNQNSKPMQNMSGLEFTVYQNFFSDEWALNPLRSDYNLVMDQVLTGSLDVNRLNSSFIRLFNDYVLLNSNVWLGPDKTLWVPRAPMKNDYPFVTYHEEGLTDDEILKIVCEPFDLENDLLFRAHVIKLDNQNFRLICIVHHILVDGLSYKSVVLELSNYYNDDNYINSVNLEKQRKLYNGIASGFTKLIEANEHKMREFWKHHLEGLSGIDLEFLYKPKVPGSTALPVFENMVMEERFNIESETFLKVRQLSRRYKLTPYLFGQLVFGVLLHKISNQDAIGINFPVAILEGKELVFGAHINNLIIDYRFGEDTDLQELINNICIYFTDLKSTKAKYLPVGETIRYAAESSLFELGFIQTDLKDLAINYSGINHVTIKDELNIDLPYKLLFEQEISTNQINYRVRYNSDELDSELVNRFIGLYRKLYNDILEDLILHRANKKIADYSLLGYGQAQEIVYNWNATNKEYQSDKTIHQLFEEQAEKTPHKVAIVYGAVQLTYKELNERSNQLASYLIETYSIKADDLVALCLDRSENMLIAILAVLKAGAGYVPIDPTYPDERIAFILEDTRAHVILANTAHGEKLRIISADLNVIIEKNDDQDFVSRLVNYPNANAATYTRPNNLFYVIYTSGTTSRPKGVMIEHRQISTIIDAIREAYNFEAPARISAFTSFGFDVSSSEFFISLLYGNELHILSDRVRTDPEALSQYLLSNDIEYVYLPPAMLASLPKLDYKSLKTIVYAGEPCDFETGAYWSAAKRLYNYYGPTETNIATGKLIHNGDVHLIGKPVANTTVYILDKYMHPQPVGAIGEIYIGGNGVARGYLNLDELTKERFIVNPFQTEGEKREGGNGRMYKTGDLGRYAPDGNIAYMGRNDFQVKIRGFRIEPGEIEAVLASYPGIKQAVVMAREKDGIKYLTGYYVADAPMVHDQLFIFLGKHLPEYMVPAALVHLNLLPVNINGKLDRMAFPEAGFTQRSTYIMPENDLQKNICGIFAEVLGLDAYEIGIDDNFFRLGGNSILAIRLANKIRKKFDAGISLASVFSSKTIRAMSEQLLYGDMDKIRIPAAENGSGPFSLSFAQERLRFIAEYEGGSSAYNIPVAYKINKTVDIESLSYAFQAIMSRHEPLRTLLMTTKEGMGCQVVQDLAQMPLEIDRVEVATEIELHEALNTSFKYHFKLDSEYPIKVKLYTLKGKKAPQKYISIVIHHTAFDGWSADIMGHEMAMLYNYFEALKSGDTSKANVYTLSPLKIQYKDFAAWQRNYLKGPVYEKQLTYWKSQLEGMEMLNLPTDKVRPARIDHAGADVYFDIDKDTANKLRAVANELEVSMYSLLLSGYYLLLGSFSNQRDIVIGTPVAGRHYPELMDMIGLFVNTLVLREEIDDEMAVTDFIKQVGNAVIGGQCHQDLPFEKLVSELGIQQDTSRHPIFQVMFGVQDFGEKENAELSRMFKKYRTDEHTYGAKFDITTLLNDSGETIKGSFNYATSLFEEATIRSYVSVYKQIISQFSQLGTVSARNKIKDLSYLQPADYKKIIFDWNKTAKQYPMDKTIHELFEAQAERTPDNVALVYENISLTYNELNGMANQLACYLKTMYDIQPDDLVVICLDRSEYMLVSILAVLKAGGAYVPADPAYPQERIAYIMEDTKTKVVLTTMLHYDKIKDNCNDIVKAICVDDNDFREKLKRNPKANPESKATSLNLAYVIYTSGTTGIPKGVMLQHQGVVNRIVWMNEEYPLCTSDRILQKTPYVFDVSVWELFWAHWYGACIVFARPEGQKDSMYLARLIQDAQVSVIHFVPSMLGVFEDTLEHEPELRQQVTSLRYLFCSGEALTLAHVKKSQELMPMAQIHNLYGPTEASVDVLHYDCNNKNITNVLIGKPIANTSMYIMDKYLRPLAVGAIGELYIGGDGVARGYLNLDSLTRERFITNPFQTGQEKKANRNGRLYKTGDLVRYVQDGNIEYLGRNDFQVKIRGYRIELGEIEVRLAAYPAIKQAIVIARETAGTKYLTGYYVSDSPITEDLVLAYLNEYLPPYMVPAALVQLDALPITINGKLDRKALQDPGFTQKGTYTAPENEIQKRLTDIYAEVLGLDASEISIDDDFFRLGGNSILAIKLVSRINSTLETNINLASIFSTKTIRALSELLLLENFRTIKIVPMHDHSDNWLLSFAQERLWFIGTFEGASNAYNIPISLKLEPFVDLERMILALEAVVKRHEVLRSFINTTEYGTGHQTVQDDALNVTQIQVFSQEELDETLYNCARHIFDLGVEYPIRATICKKEEDIYLSLVIHHIAFDGWSIGILIKEVFSLYQGHQLPNNVNNNDVGDTLLAPLHIQYKDFASWQRKYLTGEILDNQVAYWTNTLSGYETLNLLTDRVRPSKVNYEGAEVSFEIDKETTNQLKTVAKTLEVSMYSLMLSGYYLMLSSYSHQNDIVVGAPVANRHHQDLQDMIGFFVNTLALRQIIDPNQSLCDFIKQVGGAVVQAQLHQDLPFEKLVTALEIPKDASRHPIFQVMFSVQDFGGAENENISELFDNYTTQTREKFSPARFDLTTIINDSGEEIRGTFNYALSLFEEKTICAFISTYKEILGQLTQLNDENKNRKKVKELRYLNADDNDKLVNQWNDTEKDYPGDNDVQMLFEEQAEKWPDNIALVCDDVKVSYSELNERSNQFAAYLKEEYLVAPDDLIGICLDRSEHMFVAMLAILKAGGAYVPLDPANPDERMRFIAGDARPKVILTAQKYLGKLKQCINDTIQVLNINDAILAASLIQSGPANPFHSAMPSNLAYVIYTSGTTGNPKGVMVEHRSVVNYLRGFNDSVPATIKRVDFSSNLFFDLSVTTTLYPLCFGKTVYIYSDVISNIEAYTKHLNDNAVDMVKSTPGFLSLIQHDKVLIKLAVTGGEKLLKNNIKSILAYSEAIIDEYGPTETTVGVTHYKIAQDTEKFSIGRALPNTRLYVLDSELRMVPIGAIGELYIGGAGLSRGYLNLSDLTSQRFIVNPFQTEKEKTENKNDRLYKTGDLVHYSADGNLNYIGRNDFQVKIRGYRIEPGEIEAKILSYPGVTQSAVIVKEQQSGAAFLAAYYVSEENIDQDQLVKYLKAHLPAYMVPVLLMRLEQIPLTVNGKLNRNALPDTGDEKAVEYCAPENFKQMRLCSIYADALALDPEKISIDDDFFKLGGDSILAIQLVSKINRTFKSGISLTEVFMGKSVRKLSATIKEGINSYEPIVKLNKAEDKDKMFMIHPGNGGCEVYISLAEKLNDQFSCYGVDSYNLYNDNQVEDLGMLAADYLSQIDKTQDSAGNEPYWLLGWSLGGQIGLEIAAQLEKRGARDITVFLMDTLMTDERLEELRTVPTDEELEYVLNKVANVGVHEDRYRRYYMAQVELAKQALSHQLEYTRVVLFKAMTMPEDMVESESNEIVMEYIKSLECNNIDHCLAFPEEQLRIVQMHNMHHFLMLKDEEMILSEMIKTVQMKNEVNILVQ